jgi:hypothetical protein
LIWYDYFLGLGVAFLGEGEAAFLQVVMTHFCPFSEPLQDLIFDAHASFHGSRFQPDAPLAYVVFL